MEGAERGRGIGESKSKGITKSNAPSLGWLLACYTGRLWPFKHDLREWAYRYIEPVYSFFAPKRVVFLMRGEPLPDEDSFPWSIDQKRTWILSFVRLGVLFMN